MVLEQLDTHFENKNEPCPFPHHTITSYHLKMDHESKYKSENYKTS